MILKFRAFYKVNQKMYEVLTLDIIDKKALIKNNDNLECLLIGYAKMNEVELMQSTGLFDKYGVEIYEGDIVIDTVGPQIKMVVKWIDDCAAFRTVGTYEGKNFVGYVGHETKFGKNTCQVIGNIYENLEFLEVEE